MWLFRSERVALPVALALSLAACGNDRALVTDAGPVDAHLPADASGPDLLPCEVRDVLAARCATCHGSPPSAGAKVALHARYAFFAASLDDSVANVGASAALRLDDARAPMPPASEPPLPDSERATLKAWLAAGMPAGTCEPLPAAPVPTTCASGTSWMQGDTGSEQMYPGRACRTCHQQAAPQLAYYFAGTVFPSFHERDDCNAPPPADARIEILDPKTGAVSKTLRPNAAGNFLSTSVAPDVAVPYTARLVANGRMREMTHAQQSGDCNSCHTEQGTTIAPEVDAPPGRLVWP